MSTNEQQASNEPISNDNSVILTTENNYVDDYTDPRSPQHFNEGLLNFNEMPDASRKLIFSIQAEIYNRKQNSSKVDFSGPFNALTPSIALNDTLVVRDGLQRKIPRITYIPLPSYFPIDVSDQDTEGDRVRLRLRPPVIACSEHQQVIPRSIAPITQEILSMLNVTSSSLSQLRSLRNLRTDGFDGQLLLDFIKNNAGLYIAQKSWARATTVRLGLGLSLNLAAFASPYMADYSRFASGYSLGAETNVMSFNDVLLNRRVLGTPCELNSISIDFHMTHEEVPVHVMPGVVGCSFKAFINTYSSDLAYRVVVPEVIEEKTIYYAYSIADYVYVDSNMNLDTMMQVGLNQLGAFWNPWKVRTGTITGEAIDGDDDLVNEDDYEMMPIPFCNKLSEVKTLPRTTSYDFIPVGSDHIQTIECVNMPCYLFVFCDQYSDDLSCPFLADWGTLIDSQDDTALRLLNRNEMSGFYINIPDYFHDLSLYRERTAIADALNVWLTRFSTHEEREIVDVLCADLSRRRSIQYSDSPGNEDNQSRLTSGSIRGFKYGYGLMRAVYYTDNSFEELLTLRPNNIDDEYSRSAYVLWATSMTSCSGIRISSSVIDDVEDSFLFRPTCSIPQFNKEIICSYILNLYNFEQSKIVRTPKVEYEYWYMNYICDRLALITDIVSQIYNMNGWKSTIDERYCEQQSTTSTCLESCRLTKSNYIFALSLDPFSPTMGGDVTFNLGILYGGADIPIVTVNPMFCDAWASQIAPLISEQKRFLEIDVMQKEVDETTDIMYSKIDLYTTDINILKNIYWLSLSNNYRYSSSLQFNLASVWFSCNKAQICEYANQELNELNLWNFNNLLQLEWRARSAWTNGMYPRPNVSAISVPYLLFSCQDPADDVNTQIFFTGHMLHTGDDMVLSNYYLETATTKLHITPITRANVGKGVKRSFGRVMPKN